MPARITSAPQNREYIKTLQPISDTDIMAEILAGLQPSEQISCARIINRTQANPKGKWEHYGWPINGQNPFDQFEHEVESFFCTAIVKKGSTTPYMRGEPVGIFGIMLDDVGSVANESTLTASKGFLKPSIITETSPGNYQWVYLFDGILRVTQMGVPVLIQPFGRVDLERPGNGQHGKSNGGVIVGRQAHTEIACSGQAPCSRMVTIH